MRRIGCSRTGLTVQVYFSFSPISNQFRADQRPAFRVLDRDRDGVLSATEIASANENLEKCDADRNQIVDVIEISNAARKTIDATAVSTPTAPLLLTIDELRYLTPGDPLVGARLSSLDANHDGQFSDDEIEALRKTAPDVELVAEFQTTDTERSKLRLTSLSDRVQVTDSTTLRDGIPCLHGIDRSLFYRGSTTRLASTILRSSFFGCRYGRLSTSANARSK